MEETHLLQPAFQLKLLKLTLALLLSYFHLIPKKYWLQWSMMSVLRTHSDLSSARDWQLEPPDDPQSALPHLSPMSLQSWRLARNECVYVFSWVLDISPVHVSYLMKMLAQMTGIFLSFAYHVSQSWYSNWSWTYDFFEILIWKLRFWLEAFCRSYLFRKYDVAGTRRVLGGMQRQNPSHPLFHPLGGR